MPRMSPANRPGVVPFEPHFRRKVPSGVNTCTRKLLVSTTYRLSSASNAMPCGCLNCPFAVPKLPNCPFSEPVSVVITMLLSDVSATYTVPVEETTTREGYRYLPGPLPLEPHD